MIDCASADQEAGDRHRAAAKEIDKEIILHLFLNKRGGVPELKTYIPE